MAGVLDGLGSNFGSPFSDPRPATGTSGEWQLDLGGLDSEEPQDWSPDDWLAEAAARDLAASQSDADAEAAALMRQGVTPTTRNEPATVPAPMGAATAGGSIAAFVDRAMEWVGSMYDWGGNGQNGRGVDCSGLVYAAARAAGFNIQRYRAVDYGHMGRAVSTEEARPGDLVYFDNPGDTDHVGIYLGSGKFIESPQPGQRVQVSNLRDGAQIRRVMPDSAYGELPTSPSGNYVYNGPQGDRYVAEGRTNIDFDAMVQGDPVDMIMALANGQQPEGEQDSTAGLPISLGADQTLGFDGQQDAAGGYTVGQVSGLSEAEAFLIQHESGGDPTADNPSSTAFGIWQGLEGTRREYAEKFGFSPDTTNVREQLVMFRAYVRDRYTTAENAIRFWQENNWY